MDRPVVVASLTILSRVGPPKTQKNKINVPFLVSKPTLITFST